MLTGAARLHNPLRPRSSEDLSGVMYTEEDWDRLCLEKSAFLVKTEMYVCSATPIIAAEKSVNFDTIVWAGIQNPRNAHQTESRVRVLIAVIGHSCPTEI